MAVLNARAGTLGLKIVYVGAAFGGKTTNLQHLHRTLPPDRRGRLTSLAGDGERTLFFDFMAFELGVVAGLKTHFHLYTVPGQPELIASRRAVLRGADGTDLRRRLAGRARWPRTATRWPTSTPRSRRWAASRPRSRACSSSTSATCRA